MKPSAMVRSGIRNPCSHSGHPPRIGEEARNRGDTKCGRAAAGRRRGGGQQQEWQLAELEEQDAAR
jgi:hypothetical protein